MDALLEEFDDFETSWRRTLRGMRPQTTKSYIKAAAVLRQWLAAEDDPAEVEEPIERPAELAGITAAHLYGWINWMHRQGWKPATVSNRYRGAQQFFRFLTAEGVYTASPTASVRPPKVPQQHVPTVDADDLRTLLATCTGASFEALRDKAALLLYLDSGARLSEVAILLLEDVDTKKDVAYTTGKGERPRTLSYGNTTGMALERYLRVRKKHKAAARPELWLPVKGTRPLTPNAMHQMLKRRCAQAGISELHMHQLRHTMATAYLDDGGNPNDLQKLMDWNSPQMLARYTDTTARKRAIAAHKSRSLADKL
jgi:site-specific recombinase XerD